jgi:hypothetical protein
MGVQIGERQAKRPAKKHADLAGEFFYAAEAAEVLGVPGIEYRQLRDLVRVVRNGAPLEDAKWARYSLADVAGLQILIDLVGGPQVFQRGSAMRMRLKPVEDALRALTEMGFSHPLIEVPLALEGKRIVAWIEGIIIDPKSGQALLTRVEQQMRVKFRSSDREEEAIDRLRADLNQLRRTQVRRGGRSRVPLL